MKLLAFLLSVYVLMLSVSPCADGTDFHSQSPAASVSIACDHADHGEHCTPFCACACCGQTFSSVVFNYPPPSGQFISRDYPHLISATMPEVYFNIWQPPKIS